ncbi:MAG: hypothetical protein K9H58_16555 [Bacteroidales bacterium]|nr:hypothetical protein [Bacteroidales bacterium]
MQKGPVLIKRFFISLRIGLLYIAFLLGFTHTLIVHSHHAIQTENSIIIAGQEELSWTNIITTIFKFDLGNNHLDNYKGSDGSSISFCADISLCHYQLMQVYHPHNLVAFHHYLYDVFLPNLYWFNQSSGLRAPPKQIS